MGTSFTKGKDPRRFIFNEEAQKKAQITRQNKLDNMSYEELPLQSKKKRILKEQDYKCKECKISKWQEKIITLECHHIDGNNKNNIRDNLVFLCPNCHSQTDSWRKKKSSR